MTTQANTKAKPQTAIAQTKSGTSSAVKPVALKKIASTKTVPTAKRIAQEPQAKSVPKTDAPTAIKPSKPKKIKMVRDSMSIPKDEYAVLQDLKVRASKLGMPVKKTEVLRAGIKALAALSDAALLTSLKAVPSLKTGRPAKAA